MTNKKLWFEILVIVLVFTMASIGCANDAALNGTWDFEKNEIKQMPVAEAKKAMLNILKPMYDAGMISLEEYREIESEFEEMSESEIRQMLEAQIALMENQLRNSKMIFHNGNVEISLNNIISSKGNYSARSGKLRIRTTHVHGDMFNNDANFRMMGVIFDSRWYTKKELESALKDKLGEETMVLLTQFLEQMFNEQTYDYSVIGNILNMTNEYATSTYIRK